jgi:PAS domain S-box-containing protein
MGTELSGLVDALPGLVWTALPNGDVDFVNRRWCEYTGLSEEQAYARGWLTAIHADDLPDMLDGWASILDSGEPRELEARLRRFDGQYRWFDFRVSAVLDASGQVGKWCGISIDIDALKQAESRLREDASHFDAIADCIPGMLAVLSPAGKAEAFNRAAREYFNATEEELKKWEAGDFCHPDDLPRVISAWAHSVATGEPFDIERRARRGDGAYRWGHMRGLPLRDANGSILRWYVLQTDTDDRRRAEDALRASEAFLAEGQRISATGSFSWPIDAEIVAFSEELYRIFGFEQGSPVTLEQVFSRVHPEDMPMLTEKMNLARAGGKGNDYELRLWMPDDSIRYLHTVSYGTQDLNGRPEVIGAIQDITERRRADDALGKVRAELTRVARVAGLGALTASIAHEVNQPLAGIMINAGTCLRMLAAEPPNVDGAREFAQRIVSDGKRASDVIARLRSLFTKKSFATESVDLNAAAREVIALSGTEFQKQRATLRNELANDVPAVIGDRVQLQQVILNLLLNATDAVSGVDDGPRQIVIKTQRDDGDRVRLSVQDTGVGIAPQSADKLFDAFYTTKEGGMGIGLSVSHSIIESHRGRLWASPNDGPGATFSFSIPCGPPDSTA